ncbi:lecithin retinol acyltransferase family protein [Bacillus bombysepticus]|uniref:lecithin retinol acyltransferase family protein n=1 Tax=Bacillus bombysepticus TaxID=658666 RepID=UPI0030165FD0
MSHSITPIPAPKDWKYPKLNTELYPEPGLGAPIFCDLGFGYIDHSGIYIGNNEVVQLNGKGLIEKLSLEGFTINITTVNKKVVVPTDKYTHAPISFMDSYVRALEMVGSRRSYNMIIDNCHQFTTGCVTGDFEEQNNFLAFLKLTVSEQYGSDITWRRWYWHSKLLYKIQL